MMKRVRIVVFLVAACFVGATASHASPIYVSGAPAAVAGGPTVSSPALSVVEFTPLTSGLVTDLTFWTSGLPVSNATIVKWYFFADAGATPNTTPFASFAESTFTRTFQGTSGGFSQYQYDLTLTAPVSLTAGTTYWFGLSTNATANSEFWRSLASPVSTQMVQANNFGLGNGPYTWSGPFTQNGTAFELHSSAVPEPGSLFLLGSGIAGVAAKLRRRRRS